MTKILGILNLTEDSFSDGGKFLDSARAKEHGMSLFESGADALDLGAQASNVSAKPISPELEWERIQSVLPFFQEQNVPISVDTYQPYVQKKSIQAGVSFLNDIRGFVDPESQKVLAEAKEHLPQLVMMYSANQSRFATTDSQLRLEEVVEKALEFLSQQKALLLGLGVPLDKMIFDPGMGFFLGKDPDLSFRVLKEWKIFQKELGPVLISVSRKSFLGAVLGNRPIAERSSATLAVETLLMQEGVDYLRTHDAKATADARAVVQALRSVRL